MLRKTSHIYIMTADFKQEYSSCFKLNDAFSETIRAKPTTSSVCPQGNMASTRRLVKETAACYFIGYYIS